MPVKTEMQKILVTGAAGFIGYHLVKKLVSTNNQVVGLDNINAYYDENLKLNRLYDCGIANGADIPFNVYMKSEHYDNYSFIRTNLEDRDQLNNLFKKENFDIVCNLAAQAGVRYSLTHPYEYINSNVIGFFNILENCRKYNIKHLVYASSSSVYGLNSKIPFSTNDNVDHPVSVYAASKKSNELFAHTYSYLYKLPTTGLRFFTVFGPWGRPDMAYFIFTEAIINGKQIDVYNNGEMERDFTYIDDIIDGIAKIIKIIPMDGQKPTSERDFRPSIAPYRIYNIGNNSPVRLVDFIRHIENCLNKKASMRMLPLQPGDVIRTWADIDDLSEVCGFSPKIGIEEGLAKFVNWYKSYYKIS